MPAMTPVFSSPAPSSRARMTCRFGPITPSSTPRMCALKVDALAAVHARDALGHLPAANLGDRERRPGSRTAVAETGRCGDQGAAQSPSARLAARRPRSRRAVTARGCRQDGSVMTRGPKGVKRAGRLASYGRTIVDAVRTTLVRFRCTCGALPRFSFVSGPATDRVPFSARYWWWYGPTAEGAAV